MATLWDSKCCCHWGRWIVKHDGMFNMADVVASVTDGIATGSMYLVVFYFILILVLWCWVEPHPICESDGICLCFCSGMDCWPLYMDSFITLMRLWSSLPTILKLSSAVVWPVVLQWSYIGEWTFRCSLNLSPNVPADSPIYSSSHSNLSALYLYMRPLFLVMFVLCLWVPPGGLW